ncbi:hypothetical protein D1007_40147 [Hordeum vulgare]|nr:hypothetical protein D1007_40147 [Hordeum vulgare]
MQVVSPAFGLGRLEKFIFLGSPLKLLLLRNWNLAAEVVPFKIKGYKSSEVGYVVPSIAPCKSLLGNDRFPIVMDGKCPVNKLLETFNTWRVWGRAEEGNSWSVPLRWLKLTSRIVMLLDDTNSDGRPLQSEL